VYLASARVLVSLVLVLFSSFSLLETYGVGASRSSWNQA
jgi:hypothetical protein